MTVNWTKEQKAVIESRNRNLLVSAAAGSGKTAVLVERIIRMITGDSPIDIDRLLVMTFTKAAAAEMRERIQAAIEKNWKKIPGMSICSSRPSRYSLPRLRRLTVSVYIF